MTSNEKFKNITLEQLTHMVANGFAQTHADIETLKVGLEAHRQETLAGFAHLNIELQKHMGDVRKDTDAVAKRVKKLEDAVFGVGN